jgi:hypothetical protein
MPCAFASLRLCVEGIFRAVTPKKQVCHPRSRNTPQTLRITGVRLAHSGIASASMPASLFLRNGLTLGSSRVTAPVHVDRRLTPRSNARRINDAIGARPGEQVIQRRVDAPLADGGVFRCGKEGAGIRQACQIEDDAVVPLVTADCLSTFELPEQARSCRGWRKVESGCRG